MDAPDERMLEGQSRGKTGNHRKGQIAPLDPISHERAMNSHYVCIPVTQQVHRGSV
jgi:hypothetical protein